MGEHLLCTQGVRSSTLLTSTTSSLRRGFLFEVHMLSIDLHGLRHEDAKHKLELFINEHWGKQFLVVTGHSPPMREIVFKLALEYSLTYYHEPLGTSIIIQPH